jgi:Phosphopantetheine attachment site
MGLDTVELVIAVEEKFQITISDEEAQDMRTVGDMYQCVMGKLTIAPNTEASDVKRAWTADEVWSFLVSVIRSQTGVKHFTKDSRFVEDLKMD